MEYIITRAAANGNGGDMDMLEERKIDLRQSAASKIYTNHKTHLYELAPGPSNIITVCIVGELHLHVCHTGIFILHHLFKCSPDCLCALFLGKICARAWNCLIEKADPYTRLHFMMIIVSTFQLLISFQAILIFSTNLSDISLAVVHVLLWLIPLTYLPLSHHQTVLSPLLSFIRFNCYHQYGWNTLVWYVLVRFSCWAFSFSFSVILVREYVKGHRVKNQILGIKTNKPSGFIAWCIDLT